MKKIQKNLNNNNKEYQIFQSINFTLISDSKQKIKTNIESFVLCPSCDNKFDNDIIPKNLPCGHTICQICFETLKRISKMKDYIQCPFENNNFKIDENLPVSTSFYILQLNQQIQENLDTLEPSKFEKKIRNMAYSSMKTTLVNNKYDENKRKTYSELISTDIKKKLNEILKEDHTFSYILFLFKKDFSFSFACSSFNYYNEEVHCHEKYEDNDWVCVSYIYIFNNSNNSKDLKGGNEFTLLSPQVIKKKNQIEKLTQPDDMLKLVTFEIEKFVFGKEYNQNEANTYGAFICENIKNNLRSLQQNYSYCVDCIISNVNVEEYGRFGGHYKKDEVLRFPIKYNIPHTIYCLVNVCCFKVLNKENN